MTLVSICLLTSAVKRFRPARAGAGRTHRPAAKILFAAGITFTRLLASSYATFRVFFEKIGNQRAFALTLLYAAFTLEAFHGGPIGSDQYNDARRPCGKKLGFLLLAAVRRPTSDQERDRQTDFGTDRSDPTQDERYRAADLRRHRRYADRSRPHRAAQFWCVRGKNAQGAQGPKPAHRRTGRRRAQESRHFQARQGDGRSRAQVRAHSRSSRPGVHRGAWSG